MFVSWTKALIVAAAAVVSTRPFVRGSASDGGTVEGDGMSTTELLWLSSADIFAQLTFLQKPGSAQRMQPSLFKYGAGQWLWDSCGAIIANVHRDIDDAILEFRTLMNAQVDNELDGAVSCLAASNTICCVPVADL
ncbi:unnamed protein product [Phytophthora lilii]|uniref:Unnamed protein product n=1 Tax=Phytophthora lilii TaxID=2077276 RepID=A0A9W6T7U4_9STRA|nr:unnamed protein product [Phytophthora lilii]